MRKKNYIFRILFVGVIISSTLIETSAQKGFISFADKETQLSEKDVITPVFKMSTDGNTSLTLDYTFDGLIVTDVVEGNQTFQLIQINTFGSHQEEGKPSLPVRTENIVVPYNTKPVISILESDFVEMDGYTIYPTRIESEYDSELADSEIVFDQDVYSNDSFFPANPVFVSNQQKMRGVSFASVKIYPVQYNPVTKMIRAYSKLSIRVDFVPVSSGITGMAAPKLSSAKNSLLSNIALNPEVLDSYAPQDKALETVTVEEIGYLILTIPEYESAAEILKQWRQQMGYKVEIISQTSWTTSQVKNSIQTRYDTWETPPSYFLILGDQEDVPAQMFERYDDRFNDFEYAYADFYYSCMDGPGDKMPDLARGRIPVNSLDEAQIIINKIIDYETNPTTEDHFYQNAIHSAFFEDARDDDGELTNVSFKRYVYTSEEARDYTMDLGYDIQRIYTTDSDDPMKYSTWYASGDYLPDELRMSNGFNWDGNKDDLIQGINEGAFYLFHRDHGVILGWRDPEFHIEDLDRLNNNDKLPVVFSVNCHTGRFQESTDCFAEALLEKEDGGAAGVFAATEQTWSGYNDALIEGFIDAIWPSPGLIPQFGSTTEAVINPTLTPHEAVYTMGDVLNQGLLSMTETYDGWATTFQYERFHYFGDPAMKIWTAKPTKITAEHPILLVPGSDSLQITASNCPNGLATVCFNNELQAMVVLEGGTGTFKFHEPIPENLINAVLTISAHNYKPYITPISETAEPIANFSAEETNLCQNEQVTITDLSEELPTSWEWQVTPETYEFVDGTGSRSRNLEIKFLAEGNYTIKLTATNSIGTSSMQKTDYITVMESPDNPTVLDVERCDVGSVILEATGSSGVYRWWDASSDGIQVGSLEDFETPELTATTSFFVEAVNIYTTAEAGDDLECTSQRVEIKAIILNPPEAPNVTDITLKCYDEAIPALTAEGENIRWYTNLGAGELLAEGNEFTPVDIQLGINKFYATQTTNNCEGDTALVMLDAHGEVDLPMVMELTICEYDTAFCIAIGDEINWYTTVGDENPFAENKDTFTISSLTAGEHKYFATNTVEGCESELAECNVIVNAQPAQPVLENKKACLGELVIITFEGDSINWYSSLSSSTILNSGADYDLGELSSGNYTYYIAQTINNCTSERGEVQVLVSEKPEKPILEAEDFCYGEVVTLNFEGDSIDWYADSVSTSILNPGSEYELGQLAVGDYTYFVAQTIANCTSDRGEAIVHVNELPVFDIGKDSTIDLNSEIELSCAIDGEYLWFNGATDSYTTFKARDYGLGEHVCWLQITDSIHCSAADSILVVVTTPDINPDQNEFSLLIYPNPTNGLLHLGFDESLKSSTLIVVTDPQGRIVYQDELSKIFPDSIVEVNMSDLSEGIYFLTIQNKDFASTYKIFLK